MYSEVKNEVNYTMSDMQKQSRVYVFLKESVLMEYSPLNILMEVMTIVIGQTSNGKMLERLYSIPEKRQKMH